MKCQKYIILLLWLISQLGIFEKSDHYANKSLKKDKKNTKADLLISRSKKYNKNNSHLNLMIEKSNEIELNKYQKIDLNFAIAKAMKILEK